MTPCRQASHLAPPNPSSARARAPSPAGSAATGAPLRVPFVFRPASSSPHPPLRVCVASPRAPLPRLCVTASPGHRPHLPQPGLRRTPRTRTPSTATTSKRPTSCRRPILCGPLPAAGSPPWPPSAGARVPPSSTPVPAARRPRARVLCSRRSVRRPVPMLNGPEELYKCIVDLLLTMFDLFLSGVPQNHLDTKVPDGLSMGMGKDVWVVLLQFILLLVIIWKWTAMFQQNSNFSRLLRRGPIRSRDRVVLAHFLLNERLRRVACWAMVSAILSRHSAVIILHAPEQRTPSSVQRI